MKRRSLPDLVFDLGGEGWEVLVDVSDESGKVRGIARELLLAFGVADECGWENDFDAEMA